MAASSNQVATLDPRVDALIKLAHDGVTRNRLKNVDVLLDLVNGSPNDGSRAEDGRSQTLYQALADVTAEARTAALKLSDKKSRSGSEACQVAAAGELLDLSDEGQFSAIFAGNADALAHFFTVTRDVTSYMKRKLRAVRWVGSANVKTAERNAKICWYPTLLSYLEHYFASSTSRAASDRPASVVPPRAAQPSGYIHRAREEAEFHKLVKEGAKLIVFVGQAGMGKTSLAVALAGDAHIIRLSADEVHLGDLTAAFNATGIQSSHMLKDVRERLGLLTCGEDAPRFVVLDNLDSTDQLLSLLPSRTDSIIVATCRRKGNVLSSRCEFIDVRQMASSEAEAVVKTFAPSLTTDEAHKIAKVLNGYPLAIRYACALLPHSGRSVQEFCDELRNDVRTVAQNAYTGDGSTLVAVLRRTVALVAERDAFSYALLVAISFMDEPEVCQEFLEAYLWVIDQNASSARFAQALLVLHDFYIVEGRDSDYFGEPERAIVIHPLTQEILRSEFGEAMLDVGRNALAVHREAGELMLIAGGHRGAVRYRSLVISGAALYRRIRGAASIYVWLMKTFSLVPPPALGEEGAQLWSDWHDEYNRYNREWLSNQPCC